MLPVKHAVRAALLAISALPTLLAVAAPAAAVAIDPRSVTWNIVSDQDMSRICRSHGLRANCEGMAAWNDASKSCVIWTRSPRGPADQSRWQVVHHELQHCQEGHFHQ